MTQPEMAASNALLGDAGRRYVLCCNRAENDEHWQSSAPEWVGEASMSQRHRFLTAHKHSQTCRPGHGRTGYLRLEARSCLRAAILWAPE